MIMIFMYATADGLKYLRVHGITHRDIKPSNILCTKTEDGRYAEVFIIVYFVLMFFFH